MPIWNHFCRFSTALACFFACSAQAAPLPPFDASGIYYFGWQGFKFGEASFVAHETKGHFHAEADIRSTGLLQFFSPHTSHTTLDAGLNGNIATSERVYETHYTTKGEPRHVRLAFAEGGAVVVEVVEPPENRQLRPEVPAHLKKAALDPLSYVLAVRQAVHDALESGATHISLRLFEGRRLMDTDFVLAGHTFLTQDRKKLPVIRLIGHRKAVAGYTAKELKSLARGDPPLIVYFSDDAKLQLLRMEVPLAIGALHADLVRECAVKKPCGLGKH